MASADNHSGKLLVVFAKLSFFQFYDCHVLQVKPEVTKINKLGFINCQVGAGTKKLKNATLPEVGHCAKHGLCGPKRKIVEFKITPDAIIPPGTELTAMHFIPGQHVDITSTSKGKGFAGVMKRYGFHGMRATHGVSKTHRGLGSTGQCQDPGKVWKGKKMPGRMGGNRVTQSKMQVVRVDPVKNLIYIRGTIPGPKNCWVQVRDAWTMPQPRKAPFPTHIPSEK
jgi:large subunit ribosomal protein L3